MLNAGNIFDIWTIYNTHREPWQDSFSFLYHLVQKLQLLQKRGSAMRNHGCVCRVKTWSLCNVWLFKLRLMHVSPEYTKAVSLCPEGCIWPHRAGFWVFLQCFPFSGQFGKGQDWEEKLTGWIHARTTTLVQTKGSSSPTATTESRGTVMASSYHAKRPREGFKRMVCFASLQWYALQVAGLFTIILGWLKSITSPQLTCSLHFFPIMPPQRRRWARLAFLHNCCKNEQSRQLSSVSSRTASVMGLPWLACKDKGSGPWVAVVMFMASPGVIIIDGHHCWQFSYQLDTILRLTLGLVCFLSLRVVPIEPPCPLSPNSLQIQARCCC